MTAVSRIDAFQRRHPVIGFPLAVAYKFFDDQGVYLAALITYYGFLSLFPLLLLLASVLGFVLDDDPDLQDRILDSTLSQFPIIGEQLRDPQGLQGSGVAAVIGAIVAIYGALGVAQALQNAMNVAWAVPRHRRPNPITARGRSLLLVATAGLAVLATTTLAALAGAVGAGEGALNRPTSLAVTAGAVIVDAMILAVVFRIATAAPIAFGAVVPGAFFASIVWQLLQVFGTVYVDGVVKDAGLAYGVFAIVLGLLAWIFLAALGVIVGVELNVVRTKRLYHERYSRRSRTTSISPAPTAARIPTPPSPSATRASSRSSSASTPRTIPTARPTPCTAPPRPTTSRRRRPARREPTGYTPISTHANR